jgi:hypothetical protein
MRTGSAQEPGNACPKATLRSRRIDQACMPWWHLSLSEKRALVRTGPFDFLLKGMGDLVYHPEYQERITA